MRLKQCLSMRTFYFTFSVGVTHILRIRLIIHLEYSLGGLHCWYSSNVQYVCVQILLSPVLVS